MEAAEKLQFAMNLVSAPRIHKGPVQVSLDLTSRCHMNCIFCGACKSKNEEMDFSTVMRLVRDFSLLKVRQVMISGGGEPLLYPFLFDTIEELKKKGIRVGITTNGAELDNSSISRLIRLGVDLIIFSISAYDEQSYVSIRKSAKVDFRLVVSSMASIRALRHRLNVIKPRIGNSHIVIKANQAHLTDMMNLSKRSGADFVHLQPHYLFVKHDESLLLTKEEILSVLRRLLPHESAIHSGDDMYAKRINSVFATQGVYHNYLVQQVPCYFSVYSTKIRADGRVYPCACKRVPEMELGNVRSERFKEIWFSKRYTDFRIMAMIASKKRYPLPDYCQNYCNYFYQNMKIFKRVNQLGYLKVKQKVNSLRLMKV